MNRTKLRSSGHFQILTKIAYPRLCRNLEKRLILKSVFIDSKTAKVSQDNDIRL